MWELRFTVQNFSMKDGPETDRNELSVYYETMNELASKDDVTRTSAAAWLMSYYNPELDLSKIAPAEHQFDLKKVMKENL